MADDRSITGSAATEDSVHDDDELAEVLAAELERYATGSVPTLPRVSAPTAREEPMQPLAVPRLDVPARTPAAPAPTVADGAFARRAAEVERAMREVQTASTPIPTLPTDPAREASTPGETFRRAERPTGRRSATGPIVQQPSLTADDLPVKRRTGFRPPPSAIVRAPIEPIDRVLPPTGPASLPEPTASLLDAMITGSIPVIDTPTQRRSRHAAPAGEPMPEPIPMVPPQASVAEVAPAQAPFAQVSPAQAAAAQVPPLAASDAPAAPGEVAHTNGFYEDWEQSLRAIGRPRLPWEVDDEPIVPTGGDVDLATVALPVQGTGPVTRHEPTAWSRPETPSQAETRPEPETDHRGAHALPPESAPVELPDQAAARPRRSGRRRAAVPADVVPEPPTDPTPPFAPEPWPASDQQPETLPAPFVDRAVAPSGDVDEEGIDEFAVDYPVVSAATTGAVDLPQVEPRPRTAPVLIERVRTALLQLPSVPPSPTGTGAAAIVGRWVGAFASPLVLVLAFGLAAAGSGSAAVVAVIAGALLAVPALVRTAAWSAAAKDDGAMQEAALLGPSAGRGVAVLLLLARLGAAAAVLLAVGSTAGAWADRTGALGLTASNAALLGCTAVGLLGILCAALPARATAALTLLVAVVGAVGTLLVGLVLAPNGGSPIATTASGAVAGGAAGFAGIGLLMVLCGADVARWRTAIANPVSTAVGGVVALLCGAAILVGGTLIASRLTGGGDAVDEFAGALSDASASLLAGPMLVILLLSAITLPALLLRSAGASAARLLGGGRPVRLGAVASGLLALAIALGLLAAGTDTTGAVLAAAALCGAPVAAWAGLLVTTSALRKPAVGVAGIAVGTLVGWLLSDGLVPGFTSPLLAALPASTGLHGGPAVGLVAALVVGAIAGLVGGTLRAPAGRSVVRTADTVEG